VNRRTGGQTDKRTTSGLPLSRITRHASRVPHHRRDENCRPKKDPLQKAGPAIIILLGALIYSNSFSCSFHFDDFRHIVYNNAIRDLWDVTAWWNYNPGRVVSIFSFVLNYHFFKLDVGYWHLANLGIHLLNALLVRWFTLLILSSPAMHGRPIVKHKQAIALATALMFVSHPLATQSVTYIVQRMTSLAALFYLLSLALYMKGRLTGKGKLPGILLFAGSAVSAILAMLSKENAFTVPFAVILVELFFFRDQKFPVNFRSYRVIALLGACLAMAAIVVMKFRFSIFDPIPPVSGRMVTITPLNYLFTQFSVIVKYIQLLILPVNQHLEYDFPVSAGFLQPATLFSFLLLLSLVILAVYLFKKERLISFGIFWFFLTLSVESGVIPIQDVIVEHRTYLPSVGFFLILGTVIYSLLWKRNRFLAMMVWALLILTWSGMTFHRNPVWKDDLTLLNDNIEKAPEFARPYSNRGVIYWKQKAYDSAIADFSRAVAINPGYRDAYYNRGVVFEETGQFARAVDDYSQVIAIDRDEAIAYYNRGVVYFRLGENQKAIGDYSRAIEINSKYADAWNNRGVVYVNLKEYDRALADFTMAIAIRPDYTDAFSNRGATYSHLSEYDKAIVDYTRAIAINPQYKEAYVNRAIACGNLGQWDKAVADYTRALAIDPYYAQASSNREIALQKLQKK
jgi:tetratricopeptide (TPR) repeat protein